MRVSSYILFDGNCAEAMKFYCATFDATLTLTTVGQSPMRAMFPAALQSRIVNARLTGVHIDISASDWLRPAGAPVCGNMVCLYLSGGSPAEVKRIFSTLSADANITDPITEHAYGVYGALNDKFGVRWMFHAENA